MARNKQSENMTEQQNIEDNKTKETEKMAKIKTQNGYTITVEANRVEIDGVVIECGGQTTLENSEKIMINTLRKIASFSFGNRGYNTTDSRAIRKAVLDALRNIGERATL